MVDAIDTIFNKTKKGRALFQDRNALSTEFVPDRLPFRDAQTTNIAEILAPALLGSKPSNLLLYGKTGTGKTAVAKLVVRKLLVKDDTKRILTVYVNCRLAGTEYLTLAKIAEGLPMDEDKKIPLTGLSLGEVVGRIFKTISKHAIHLILVLDEIDYLVNTNDDTLYKFTRSGESTTPGFLTIIGISNDLRFKDGLDPRVLSSLGEEELVFPPYTTEELRSILEERTKVAFRPGVVPESTINLCAALAASEHGDARRAIDMLRVAGEVAEREGRQHVDEESIRKASDKIERDTVEEALQSLPLQTKIIVMATSKFPGGTNTGELYLAYTNLARKSGVEVLTQRRVSGILAELDVLGLVEAAVVSKGRRGRSKRIKLLIDNETLERVIGEDARLLDLV
ncbi:MAG: orc1/cdc6 family replication initiation protein [Thaumarchaeota archaeon]|nr:orc1/cdc6 family replication initiation protein [Nitrososphaerota archaeon]